MRPFSIRWLLINESASKMLSWSSIRWVGAGSRESRRCGQSSRSGSPARPMARLLSGGEQRCFGPAVCLNLGSSSRFPGISIADSMPHSRWNGWRLNGIRDGGTNWPMRSRRDRERDRRALLHGWRVVRFTWIDVTERPAEVVEIVRALLNQGRSSKLEHSAGDSAACEVENPGFAAPAIPRADSAAYEVDEPWVRGIRPVEPRPGPCPRR